MKSAGVNRGTTGEAMVVRNLQSGGSEEMSEAERLHRHLIGQQGSRRSLNTPALVLDLEMLDRNIAEMACFAKAHKVKLRPHSKTHKSADIATPPDRGRRARRLLRQAGRGRGAGRGRRRAACTSPRRW